MFWAFIAALCAVPVGIFLIRPRVSKLFKGDFQGVKLEAFIGPVVTLTVFLAAFVVAQATQTFQRAGSQSTSEATAVSMMYEHGGMLPDGRGQALQAASVCYARSVLSLEWPAMESGKSAPEADHWAQQFNTEITSVLDAPGSIVGQLVGLNRTQSETRQMRIYESRPHLPQLTIVLMIASIVGVILLLCSLATPDLRRRVLVPIALAMAVLLGGTLYLVEQLEEPFSGLIRVSPGLMTSVEAKASADFEVRYPGATLPCDAEGRPTD
ncbi:MAG: hypothetical protein KGR47_10195 [Acidobacteria bacterium]|nr:hypothetical protein [Acidobacteriota bacterium]